MRCQWTIIWFDFSSEKEHQKMRLLHRLLHKRYVFHKTRAICIKSFQMKSFFIYIFPSDAGLS